MSQEFGVMILAEIDRVRWNSNEHATRCRCLSMLGGV